MKPNIATNPILMQAGCAGATKPSITLQYSVANPSILRLTTDGAFNVKSIYNGQPLTQSYPAASDSIVSIQADANTDIVLEGVVKLFALSAFGEGTKSIVSFITTKQDQLLSLEICDSTPGMVPEFNTIDILSCVRLESLNCMGCTNLTELDLSANTALRSLMCANTGLSELDLSANTALAICDCSDSNSLTKLYGNARLESLNCMGCTHLTELDLSASIVLGNLHCDDCDDLTLIKYRATDEYVPSTVASAITNATATDGTVYLNSADTYYQTVADAATAKGWTIESL